MVEHAAHNRGVAGSIPATATTALSRIAESSLLRPRMLLGLSGGPDSMALLIALLEIGVRVTAAHFDHDLRPESAQDASWVRSQCEKRGVSLVTARRNKPLRQGSLETAAREARFDFFTAALAQTRLEVLALAHTADDRVESLVLNLRRGIGLAGLRGMPERRGPFVRPMLAVWRSQVLEYLEARDVTYLSDPTNDDPRHARVSVRLNLLPALAAGRPGLKERLLRVCETGALRYAEVEEAAASLIRDGGIERAQLAKAPSPIRKEALKQLYVLAGGPLPGLSGNHLAAMERLALAGTPGQRLDLPGHVALWHSYGKLEASHQGAPASPSTELRMRPCEGCSHPDSVHLREGLHLEVGSRRPGLHMRTGPGGHRRKLQDILVDAHIPRRLRDSLPLLFADGELAWVPGVALDPRFAVPPHRPGIHLQLVEAGIPSDRIG